MYFGAHDDMVTTGRLEHVRDELRGDGRAALVLFVLAGIRKQWEYRSDALCARDLARVDHDAEFHEPGVNLATRGVDDIDVVVADLVSLALDSPRFFLEIGNGCTDSAMRTVVSPPTPRWPISPLERGRPILDGGWRGERRRTVVTTVWR
jgi:hypothetical protein